MAHVIALIGDRDDTVTAHRAIPLAVRQAADACGVEVRAEWLPTDSIVRDEDLAGYDGFWCVPASPYRSMDGALRAIGHARTQARPFLGTCGGFQHAVVEYARSVLGWADADHAETAPDAARAVVVPLACSLVEVAEPVVFEAGTRIAAAYGLERIEEGYHCRYGLGPTFREAAFSDGAVRVGATDGRGDVRAIELRDHPFFVATLFQPERAALRGDVPPLVRAFVQSVARGARRPDPRDA